MRAHVTTKMETEIRGYLLNLPWKPAIVIAAATRGNTLLLLLHFNSASHSPPPPPSLSLNTAAIRR